MTTVLIADDEADHRELLTLVLERLGYDVVAAGDSTGALALLSEGGVDAALIDVRMPGISGIELCRIIRESPTTESLPVMVVSADVHRHQMTTALHAGADDFLSKPFSRAELAARLEALIGDRSCAARRSAVATRAAMLAARQARLSEPLEITAPVRRIA
ncbi:response regulator transcription factor [Actinoplanes utahensis]|uniref:Response regulator receiver protein n=1 Tax=Actinoplanes utahensis TaxID=1869 RepID=A0A0A6USQ5_ACTUT|nr:response regulator [Actinoplanes utahensis]KHD78451.1 response regulator receiver protein [Actinoplanes utahensis]